MGVHDMLVAGRRVHTWNDELWRRLRQRDDVPCDFLADARGLGPFKSGGGKGGDLMAFTRDGQFIVKELNQGDHESLLRVSRNYVDHVCGGESLLCTFYLHYEEAETGKMFVVMRNLLPHKGPWVGLYDLKGCADDKTLERYGRKVVAVHKRIWRVHMWCGDCAWSPERHTYYQGKLAARKLSIGLTDLQREKVVGYLRRDTEWLASNSLMDYSLLVGVQRMTEEEVCSDAVAVWARRAPPGKLRQPMLHRIEKTGGVMCTYIGVIDFLQSWTFGKKVAMVLKAMERNKATIPPHPYAKRFYEHFARSIHGGMRALEPLPPEEVKFNEDPAPIAVRLYSDAMSYYSCRSYDEVEALMEDDATPLDGKEPKEQLAKDPPPERKKSSASVRGSALSCFAGLFPCWCS